MKFIVEINTENAAFEDNPDEVKWLLTKSTALFSAMLDGVPPGMDEPGCESSTPLLDSNGNTVGTARIEW